MSHVVSPCARRAPWQAKMLGKLVLARLPLTAAQWHRLGLFRHGEMEDARYAYGVARHHLDALAAYRPRSFTMLELGPGNSVASAVVASAVGATHCTLVDVAPHATRELEGYAALARYLRDVGLAPPPVDQVRSFEGLLAACQASYLTEGLASLRSIPEASVDVGWSHAVLEHVRLRELEDTLAETRRVIRPGGAWSHTIDLRDHLAENLNHLRFPGWLWEADVVARSGFYTNRVRFRPFVELFAAAGFDVSIRNVHRWAAVPLSRRKLQYPYRAESDHDLCVASFDVLATPC